MYQMICYERCSTCAKAKKKLKDLGIDFTVRDVKKDPVDYDLLYRLLKRTDTPWKLFNTSGKAYREKGLSGKVKDMSLEEMANLLASDGMLIKRPLLFNDEIFLIGYQESAYESLRQ